MQRVPYILIPKTAFCQLTREILDNLSDTGPRITADALRLLQYAVEAQREQRELRGSRISDWLPASCQQSMSGARHRTSVGGGCSQRLLLSWRFAKLQSCDCEGAFSLVEDCKKKIGSSHGSLHEARAVRPLQIFRSCARGG